MCIRDSYLRICCGINRLIYAAMYTLDSFAIGVGAANVAMLNALLDAVIAVSYTHLAGKRNTVPLQSAAS